MNKVINAIFQRGQHGILFGEPGVGKTSSQKIDEISTATKNEAYVDTSAFIAFADLSDSYHALFRRLFSDPPQLTTNAVGCGVRTWMVPETLDTARGLQFLSMIEAMPLNIVSVGEREFKARRSLQSLERPVHCFN